MVNANQDLTILFFIWKEEKTLWFETSLRLQVT